MPDAPVPPAPGQSVPRFRHEAIAAVLRVGAVPEESGRLTVLAWQRQRDPYEGAWALPSGPVQPDETIGACVARNLAARMELTEIAHLEQLETRSDPARDPWQRTIATAYLGLVPVTTDLDLPPEAAWQDVTALPAMAFDHASIVVSAVHRLRSKLGYTNLGFALAPRTFTIATLRSVYAAALGYDLSATNLQRVLTRRGQLEPTGETAAPTRAGGRPAQLFRFSRYAAEVTDPAAVLRPGG